MNKQQEALKLALEALEIGHEYAVETAEHFHIEMAGYKQHRHDAMDAEVKQIADAITAIREALAEQPAQQQEPVAWILKPTMELLWPDEIEAKDPSKIKGYKPLYTSPPASKPWVGLTDEEKSDLWCESTARYCVNEDTHVFADAIEAKLKEKNT